MPGWLARRVIAAVIVKRVHSRRPSRGRPAVRTILAVLGAAGFAALTVREYPAIRREVKIWLM